MQTCIPGLGRVNKPLFKPCCSQKIPKTQHITTQPLGPALLKITFDSSTTTQDYKVHCPGCTLDNYVEILTHLHVFVMMTITAFCRTMMS